MVEGPETILRLLLAAGVGAAVGFEREAQGQLAGLRTNALVAVGAALFTLVGAYGFAELERSANVDPMRVAAQVVSGIGFIGAGVILRDGGAVRGVTTAAALWTSAALGIAAGAGQYLAAVAGTAVVLLVLIGLRAIRDRGPLSVIRRVWAIEATYDRGFGTLAPLIDAVERSGAHLESLNIEDERHSRNVRLRVRARRDAPLQTNLSDVAKRPEVRAIEVSA
jgi:putative Mg2+ transporter-C (MgtC) family protein